MSNNKIYRKSASHAVNRGAALGILIAAILGLSSARAASAPPQIPTCDKRIGTLDVNEPQDRWWAEWQLDSPASLIKVYVAQSKCFTLVDRGKGLDAAKIERDIEGGGQLRPGANIGKGQMRAADYVLVPDIANRNGHANQTNIGGLLAGYLPHGIGAIAGGLSFGSKTADVVLTLTDLRSTEQVSLEQGHAKKTDVGWDAGGFGFSNVFAAAGVSSYTNTEIGQLVAMAYLEAFSKMVADLKGNSPDSAADNLQQAVSMAKAGLLYGSPDLKSTVVRDLDPGVMLYPTGDKMGVWWKVTDELGHAGWVVSTQLQLAR